MFFWDRLESHGDRPAFIEGSDHISYQELADRADQLWKIDRPSLVLIELSNSIRSMIAYIGALRHRLPAIVVNAGDDAANDRLATHFNISARWSDRSGITSLAPMDPAPLHQDLALMLSTSGTTGVAKLVRLSAGAVDANARSIADYLGLTEAERPITTLPPGYSYGLSVINSHLSAGASIVLFDGSVVEHVLRETIERHEVTSLAGVPYSYELLERSGFLADLPPSVRTLTQAGGRLPLDRAQRIAAMSRETGRRFFMMYGQTEATARIAFVPPADLPEFADGIGRAIPGGTLSLADPDSRAPVSGTGELVYSGPNVMMGYATEPADLAAAPQPPVLHTGDLATEVKPGMFRIVGRKSRFLKLFGLRLDLDEIERAAALEHWPIVATGTDELLVLAATDANASAAAPALAARYGLPPNRVSFVLVEEMPRLSSGKVDYPAIIACAGSRDAPVDGDDRIAEVRAFYQSLSPQAKVSGATSFLSLNGDSLSYVSATIAVESALGRLPTDWERLTLDEMERLAGEFQGRGRGFFKVVEGEMVARCLAIMMITASHVWYAQKLLGTGLGGGSGLLIAIFGYNLFRFRSGSLLGGSKKTLIWSVFSRYVLPYYLVMLIFSTKDMAFDWHNFALIGVFFSGPSGALHQYWFFEVMMHLVLIISLIFSLPGLPGRIERHPDRTMLAMVVLAVAIRLIVELVRPSLGIPPRTPDAFLYLALGGIAMAAARHRMTKILVVLALVIPMMALTGVIATQWVVLVIGLSIVLFLPRIALPSPVASIIRQIARSTIYIYLCSGFVVRLFQSTLHNRYLWPHFLATIIIGMAIERMIHYFGLFWRHRRSEREAVVRRDA